MSDSIRKVDEAMASINKGVDKKEEMKTMMGPYANWDRFLVPAPLSIALLGQLILFSADTDFSLQDKNNPINFQLLKYPDSFRASLVQVSNKGWGAFNLAHTNMGQIRLHSGNVDGHVRAAVNSEYPEEVALMLPDALKSIGTIAEECVALSRSVQEEFVAEMQLVAELLEACTRTMGQYEQNLKDSKTSIEVANEYKKSIETQKELAEKKQKDDARTFGFLSTAKENDSRNQYDKSCENFKEYGDILADLAKYDLQKIDFETIRGVLINGIRALGELQEQWGKLVQFFAKLTEAGLAMSNTMRDVIFEQAFQANQIAFVVKSISSAYVEVSSDHLMDRVTCLGKLLAVDPANRHEITQKREQLNQGCKDAQKAIERIAREKKKEIDEAFDKRIGRIETEVEALMPTSEKAYEIFGIFKIRWDFLGFWGFFVIFVGFLYFFGFSWIFRDFFGFLEIFLDF